MRTFAICFLSLFVALTSAGAACPSGEDFLRERWLDLWQRLQQQGAEGDQERVYRLLSQAYCESHREYHTLAHVAHVLKEFDAVRELALWFHDVVYDIGARNNEEESARLAREEAVELGLTAEWAERVSQLVLATRHAAVPLEADAQLVVDIDLSILGQSRERFDAYEEEIRIEYAPVIEAQGTARFNTGRARILKGFLARPATYTTAHFRQKYERRARANLKRSIERLEDPAWTETVEDGQNRPDR